MAGHQSKWYNTAATDDGRTRQQSTAVMATARSRVRWWQYTAVEAAPGHCCAMEQVVTATATSDDEKDEIATINRCDGHSKTQ